METPKLLTTNKYGIAICKCCASCRHKQLDNRTRLCLAGEGAVPSSYICKEWEMSPTFAAAGKGGGRVKKSSYLQYSLKRFFDDNTAAVAAADKRLSYRRASIFEVRRDYEKVHGSIYADL